MLVWRMKARVLFTLEEVCARNGQSKSTVRIDTFQSLTCDYTTMFSSEFLQAPAPEFVRCDKIQMFQILYSAEDEHYWTEAFAKSNDENKTLFHLKSNTLYRIKVAAINNRDLVGTSEETFIRTSTAGTRWFLGAFIDSCTWFVMFLSSPRLHPSTQSIASNHSEWHHQHNHWGWQNDNPFSAKRDQSASELWFFFCSCVAPNCPECGRSWAPGWHHSGSSRGVSCSYCCIFVQVKSSTHPFHILSEFLCCVLHDLLGWTSFSNG